MYAFYGADPNQSRRPWAAALVYRYVCHLNKKLHHYTPLPAGSNPQALNSTLAVFSQGTLGLAIILYNGQLLL